MSHIVISEYLFYEGSRTFQSRILQNVANVW